MKKKRTTYTDKIGMPPGSLVYIGKETKEKVTLSEINFSFDHFEEFDLKKVFDCNTWNSNDTVTMISIIGINDISIIEEAAENILDWIQ